MTSGTLRDFTGSHPLLLSAGRCPTMPHTWWMMWIQGYQEDVYWSKGCLVLFAFALARTTLNHERLDHSTASLSWMRATLGIRRHPGPGLSKTPTCCQTATAVASSRQGLEELKSLAGACGCCFTDIFSAVCYRALGPAAKIIEISGGLSANRF